MKGTMATTAAERDLLPANVKPTHYDLEIRPDFERLRIPGRVIIDLDVREDSGEVSLHSKGITFFKVMIIPSKDSTGQIIKDIKYDDQKNLTTFVLQDILPSGSKAKLQIDFESILNENKIGIYYRKFEVNGSQMIMASSQGQPTYARLMFPCFDEPALKATFDVSVVADEHLTPLYNMNAISRSSTNDGKIRTSFATTPHMSTYLNAFIVGELD